MGLLDGFKPKVRKFGGKEYSRDSLFDKKRKAKRHAKKLRTGERKARVVKENGKWGVYKRSGYDDAKSLLVDRI